MITRSDIYEVLSNLDTTKARGSDNIHPLVLKNCSISLLEPILHLFTQCLKSGSLPSQWKIHKITPIPKKREIKNYRPISLLCVLSKVLERIIYNEVIKFIRPKLSEIQFGFLKNRSALQQLLPALALAQCFGQQAHNECTLPRLP